jgi:hypothetical protein
MGDAAALTLSWALERDRPFCADARAKIQNEIRRAHFEFESCRNVRVRGLF